MRARKRTPFIYANMSRLFMNTSDMRKLACKFLLLLLVLPSGAEIDPADQRGPAKWITRGSMPAIALDAKDRLHLVYIEPVTGRELHYRIGDLEGNFGPPEVVLTASRLWDPRIVVDENDDPHIVVSDGHFHNRYTFYVNRSNGQWRPDNTHHRLVVFDRDRDGFNRTTSPSIAVAEGRAYIGTFTAGGSGRFVNHWGAIALVQNLETSPTVTNWRHVIVWNPQVVYDNSRLWIGGRNVNVGDRRFAMREHNPETLAEFSVLQPGYLMSPQPSGEQTRVGVDRSGNIMAAGTGDNQGSSRNAGWFHSVDRINQGLAAIRYRTSLYNPNGMALPLRDDKAEDRIYIFYWSDDSSSTFEAGPWNPPECPNTVQLHFARIENGSLASELQPVTTRTEAHGGSFRATPSAIPHPHGGAIVIFRECGGDIYYTTIGEQTDPMEGHNPFARTQIDEPWRITWMGLINDEHFPWIYHSYDGWFYLAGSNDSLWLYEAQNQRWQWTNRVIFPSLYDPSSGAEHNWVINDQHIPF